MKLLLDQNLSYKLCAALDPIFPGTSHVRRCGLKDADDIEIWAYARRLGFAIVTKDRDFADVARREGHPPKLVWLRCGNRPATFIQDLLLEHAVQPLAFDDDPDASLIEIAGRGSGGKV